MDIAYLVARQQVEVATANQFRDTPEPDAPVRRVAPQPGIVTTLRIRLSADLRALAAAIEPHRPLTPQTGTPQR